MAEPITADDVRALLCARLASVLALDGPIAGDARFDEDLHADSLDLVEVIEGVERDLGERGADVALPDDELLDLRTVDDAVARIAAAAARAGA
jgi:acyl carrier protein